MTIEEKAKAYDEALERVGELLSRCIDYRDRITKVYRVEDIESIFPELKGSEDEKIRKWIINEIKVKHHNLDEDNVDFVDKAIAWLEKQGKQKVSVFDFNAKDWYVSKVDGKIHNMKYNPTDVVEPKFKVGQWIVWQNKCYKVNYNGCGYELVDQNGLSMSLEYGTIDENAHIWDIIKDAKDGDVLNSPTHNLIWIYKDNEHYHACANMNYVTENVATDGLISIPNDACPATKDEQTILFTMMHKAGYEWDSEKKELKEIATPKPEADDKIEPRFKVGDWIVFNGLTLLVNEVVQGYYRTISKGGIPNSCYWGIDYAARLWTIEDAKEGDVLSYETDEGDSWIMLYWSLYEPYEGHVHYHALLVNDNFTDKGTCCICIDDLKPATIEQHELLFCKMKEEGYQWDKNKKEIIKL